MTQVAGDVHLRTLTAGGHNCAIATDDMITCWGHNYLGQTDAPPGAHKRVAAGEAHSCVIAADGTIACWGPVPVLEDIRGHNSRCPGDNGER